MTFEERLKEIEKVFSHLKGDPDLEEVPGVQDMLWLLSQVKRYRAALNKIGNLLNDPAFEETALTKKILNIILTALSDEARP